MKINTGSSNKRGGEGGDREKVMGVGNLFLSLPFFFV